MQRCNEETGGSCKEVSDDAADTKDDGSRNQVRNRDGNEEMENTGTNETYEKMGTKNIFGYVRVLRSRRKTTEG